MTPLQKQILEYETGDESDDEEFDSGNGNEEPTLDTVQMDLLPVEDKWIHPKDRPVLTKDEFKALQKDTKELQREKRKHKMPKHEKKRKEKATKGKK